MNEKEIHTTDQLLRSRLADLEDTPSDERRRRIMATMLEANKPVSIGKRLAWSILAAASVVIFTWSVLPWLTDDTHPGKVVHQVTVPSLPEKPSTQPLSSVQNNSDETPLHAKEPINRNQLVERKASETQHAVTSPSAEKKPESHALLNRVKHTAATHKTVMQEKHQAEIAPAITDRHNQGDQINIEIPVAEVDDQTVELAPALVIQAADTISTDETTDVQTSPNETDEQPFIDGGESLMEDGGPEGTHQYFMGLYYLPEFVFGLYVDKLSRENSFDLGHSGSLAIGRIKNGMILQSGISAAYYQKNINSIVYYTPDNTHNLNASTIQADTIIQAGTNDTIIDASLISIRDGSFSSNYFGTVTSKSGVNSYIYVQIPLLFGYERSYNRLTTTVISGPVISFLASKTEAVNNSAPGYETIQLDRKTPLQMNANCLLELRLGARYALTKSCMIGIEPTFRYYISSLSGNADVQIKHPYSVGVATGIIYKLR